MGRTWSERLPSCSVRVRLGTWTTRVGRVTKFPPPKRGWVHTRCLESTREGPTRDVDTPCPWTGHRDRIPENPSPWPMRSPRFYGGPVVPSWVRPVVSNMIRIRGHHRRSVPGTLLCRPFPQTSCLPQVRVPFLPGREKTGSPVDPNLDESPSTPWNPLLRIPVEGNVDGVCVLVDPKCVPPRDRKGLEICLEGRLSLRTLPAT